MTVAAVAEPDPEEPVQRWEVTGCVNCRETIWRPARSTDRPWRHLDGQRECPPAGAS